MEKRRGKLEKITAWNKVKKKLGRKRGAGGKEKKLPATKMGKTYSG